METQEKVLDDIFSLYDVYNVGYLSAQQIQMLHSDIRLGSISIPQIEESIKYTCVSDTCDRSEVFDLLNEMDRRYYLVENLRWEFSMLDIQQSDTISEGQAKWLMEIVHGQYFCPMKWERFIRRRSVPGSNVSFSEIEVLLCNVPSKQDWLADMEEQTQHQKDLEQQRLELEKQMLNEKERKRKQRGEERKIRDEEEMRKISDQQRRQEEDEADRRQRQKERDEGSQRKQRLDDEAERGRNEAEEREKRAKEKIDEEEKILREKEGNEIQRLHQLEAQHHEEEEIKRRQDLKEAHDFEVALKDIIKKEKDAEAEADGHEQRGAEAANEHTKKDAQEAKEQARLKKKEYRSKRIRYTLKVAIKKRDRDLLRKAMTDFKRAKLPDDDQDLPKADRILKEFHARDGLQKAMTSRQLKQLENAIHFIKHNGFELQLHRELIEAHKVLLQLRRLERIRAEILELKQSTVAEIRSYQKPPPIVHIVMTGTLLLLGHKEKETKEWKNVQALVGKTGKEGIKRRCLECDPSKLDPIIAARAKQSISQYQLDDVRDVSAGAATFFLWSWTMIEESEAHKESLKKDAETKQRIREGKRLKGQQVPEENLAKSTNAKLSKNP